MKRVVTRLASMAAVVVLTVGLPAMGGAAYGARPSRGAAGPAPGPARAVARLHRLTRDLLFPVGRAAGGQGDLAGVGVRARDDGWAVGSRCSGGCRRAYTLIVHWNGRRWSRVPSPDPSASPTSGLNLLTSVTAVSGRDAWAAGTAVHGTIIRPLIMHWNGVRWSTAPSPRRTSFSQLGSISAASAQDIWAVGLYGLTDHALIEHWNGTSWRVVAAPVRPRGQEQLATVTTLSARSAWAVGSVCPDHCARANPPSRTLILHWNGRRWSPFASSSPGAASVLTGLAASSATNAWAVGGYCTKACPSPQDANRGQMLFLHWNGARWSRVAGPGLGRDVHSLSGVAALSRRSAWAVGATCIRACDDGPVTQPLTLRWSGRRWRVG